MEGHVTPPPSSFTKALALGDCPNGVWKRYSAMCKLQVELLRAYKGYCFLLNEVTGWQICSAGKSRIRHHTHGHIESYGHISGAGCYRCHVQPPTQSNQRTWTCGRMYAPGRTQFAPRGVHPYAYGCLYSALRVPVCNSFLWFVCTGGCMQDLATLVCLARGQTHVSAPIVSRLLSGHSGGGGRSGEPEKRRVRAALCKTIVQSRYDIFVNFKTLTLSPDNHFNGL